MIKGKTIALRSLEENDLEILKNWRNSPHIRKTTREYRILNMLNQKNWFSSLHQNDPPKNIIFGVENNKKNLIGVCGLTYIDWKNKHAEISIYLGKKNWQKSLLGKELLQLITDYGFGELNLHRLYAEIFSTAPENIKLFEKMNFHREGILREKLWRNGKWNYSFIYAKILKS